MVIAAGALLAGAAKIGLDVLKTYQFQLFIFEESIQAAGMGVWISIQGRQWEQAAKQAQVYGVMITTLDSWIKTPTQFIEFLSAIGEMQQLITVGEVVQKDSVLEKAFAILVAPFAAFVVASRASNQAYYARIAKELETVNPQYTTDTSAIDSAYRVGVAELQALEKSKKNEMSTNQKNEKRQMYYVLLTTKKLYARQYAAKAFTKEEYDKKIIAITKSYDIEIAKITARYDILEINQAKLFVDSLALLKRQRDLKMRAKREVAFPISTEVIGPGTPVSPVEPPPVTPPPPPPITTGTVLFTVVDKTSQAVIAGAVIAPTGLTAQTTSANGQAVFSWPINEQINYTVQAANYQLFSNYLKIFVAATEHKVEMTYVPPPPPPNVEMFEIAFPVRIAGWALTEPSSPTTSTVTEVKSGTMVWAFIEVNKVTKSLSFNSKTFLNESQIFTNSGISADPKASGYDYWGWTMYYHKMNLGALGNYREDIYVDGLLAAKVRLKVIA